MSAWRLSSANSLRNNDDARITRCTRNACRRQERCAFSCLHAFGFELLRSCFGKPSMHLQNALFRAVKTFARHALLCLPWVFVFSTVGFFLSVVALSCVSDLCAYVALLQYDRWDRRECPSLRFALLISPHQYEKPSDDHSADDDG